MIELAIGDPNPVMLQALAEVFERDRRFALVAAVKTAESFLEAILRAPVSVGVVDWTLPILGGERLIQTLSLRPESPRLVVYASSNDVDLPRRAMAAGAAGFCTRETSPDQLLDMVESVAKGRMVFPFFDIRTLKRDPAEDLTRRERSLLSALAHGRTNSELAREFAISVNTVKFHLRNLYDKLGLANRAQAIAFYYSQGMSEKIPESYIHTEG